MPPGTGRVRIPGLENLHHVVIGRALEPGWVSDVYAPGAGERTVVPEFAQDTRDGDARRAGEVRKVLMSERKRKLDAGALGIVGALTEPVREAEEGAGDTGPDGHLGLVDHLATAAHLARHAPHDVVAQAPVVHGLLQIDQGEHRVVHCDDGFGMRAAVDRGKADHVTGAVKVCDTVPTKRGWYYRLKNAVVDHVKG